MNDDAHSLALQESRLHGDITWLATADNNCARKAFLWLEHAARSHAGAAWIGKADDDSFINTVALEADLRGLEGLDPRARPALVGLINIATAWSPLEGRALGSHAGRPCGRIRQLESSGTFGKRTLANRWVGKTACNVSAEPNASLAGPYPYAVGPLYLLSAALARLAFVGTPAVHRLRGEQPFSCRAEDATIGYAIHLAGVMHGVTLSLAHLTWTKMHNFHAHRVAPSYRMPDDESVVVHNLKCSLARPALWRRLRESLTEASPRAHPLGARKGPRLELVRLEWQPRPQIMRCADSHAWSRLARRPVQIARSDPALLQARARAWREAACSWITESDAQLAVARNQTCGLRRNYSNSQLCM